MLPEGFTWHVDGMTLLMDGRSIAHMTMLGTGEKIRVTVGHWGARPGRFEFLNTYEGAQRYIESWVAKWGDQIREEIARSEKARAMDYCTQPRDPNMIIPPDPRRRSRRR